MKKNLTLLISFFAFVCFAGSKRTTKLTVNERVNKILKGVDQIVVRDGGDICCVSAKKTLKQPIFFTVNDSKEIKKVLDNLKFINKISDNSCFCCGYPGIDFYKGERRVFLTGYEHGFGLKTKGRILTFTKETKLMMARWLLKNKFPDKHKECKKIIDKLKKEKAVIK